MRVCFIFFIICLTTILGLKAQNGGFVRQTVVYEDTLALELFLPKAKSQSSRPVLVFVHGGGFSGGKRDHPALVKACEYFADKGWVTATISYHLTMKAKSFSCDQQDQKKIETIFTAAQNVNQSVAYLLKGKDTYGIDPKRMVLVGSSAGAEAVVQSVYWSKTQKDILPEGFQYGGLISMAGAILDENWITKESAVPTALFHGTCDNLVPYATAAHHYCEADAPGFMMLFGSYSIAMKLKALNKSYYLVTDCGGGHEWASKPIDANHLYMLEDFLNQEVLGGQFRQSHHVLQEGKHSCDRGLGICE